jgi:DNA-binding response OmpR family regulator
MAADALPLHGLELLIVEDEATVAVALAEFVRELGGTVLGPVDSVAAALDHARRGCLDVALLDVELRDGRVSPVALALRALGVPFILLSGHAASVLQDEPGLAAAPHLGKPFGFAAVEQALRQLARAARHASADERG